MATYGRRRRPVFSSFSVLNEDDDVASISKQHEISRSRRARSMSMTTSAAGLSHDVIDIRDEPLVVNTSRAELTLGARTAAVGRMEFPSASPPSSISSRSQLSLKDKPLPPTPQVSDADLEEAQTSSSPPLPPKRVLSDKCINTRMSSKRIKNWSLESFRKPAASESPPQGTVDPANPTPTALPRATSTFRLPKIFKSRKGAEGTYKSNEGFFQSSLELNKTHGTATNPDALNPAVYVSGTENTKSTHVFGRIKGGFTRRRPPRSAGDPKNQTRTAVVGDSPQLPSKNDAATDTDDGLRTRFAETQNLTSPKIQRYIDSPLKTRSSHSALTASSASRRPDRTRLTDTEQDLDDIFEPADVDPFVDAPRKPSQSISQDFSGFKFGFPSSSKTAHTRDEGESSSKAAERMGDVKTVQEEMEELSLIEEDDEYEEEPQRFTNRISGLRQHPNVLQFARPPKKSSPKSSTPASGRSLGSPSSHVHASFAHGHATPRNRFDGFNKRKGVALAQSPLKQVHAASDAFGTSDKKWEFVPEQARFMGESNLSEGENKVQGGDEMAIGGTATLDVPDRKPAGNRVSYNSKRSSRDAGLLTEQQSQKKSRIEVSNDNASELKTADAEEDTSDDPYDLTSLYNIYASTSHPISDYPSDEEPRVETAVAVPQPSGSQMRSAVTLDGRQARMVQIPRRSGGRPLTRPYSNVPEVDELHTPDAQYRVGKWI